MANEYATLAEARGWVGIADAGEDSRLELALEAASRAVDGVCGRRFYQDAGVSARTLRAVDPWCLSLPPGWDISTSTGLLVATDENDDGTYEVSWTLNTHYRLGPASQIGPTGEAWAWTELTAHRSGGRNWPSWSDRDAVQVTARWGWAAVPPAVKEATLVLTGDLWKLKDAPFGVAGFGEFGPLRVRQNARAVELLGPYRQGRAMVGMA